MFLNAQAVGLKNGQAAYFINELYSFIRSFFHIAIIGWYYWFKFQNLIKQTHG